MLNAAIAAQSLLDRTRALEPLAPLLLRLYLVPVFWMAGISKLRWDGTWADFALAKLWPNDGVIGWFGNPDWGLGLPAPELMAVLAAWTEAFGAVLLLLGLATRWISIPLVVTMVVAAVTVHWHNGWHAIAGAATHPAAAERLDRAKDLLREHGDWAWLSSEGSFVVLNNGIEFAATYALMLLALFFLGGGRWVSADFWIRRRVLRDT